MITLAFNSDLMASMTESTEAFSTTTLIAPSEEFLRESIGNLVMNPYGIGGSCIKNATVASTTVRTAPNIKNLLTGLDIAYELINGREAG
jgi:hypothetical protein